MLSMRQVGATVQKQIDCRASKGRCRLYIVCICQICPSTIYNDAGFGADPKNFDAEKENENLGHVPPNSLQKNAFATKKDNPMKPMKGLDHNVGKTQHEF